MPYNYLSSVRAIAMSDPRREAIATHRRSVTYGELIERVDRIATGLAELGVKERSTVPIMLWNSVEHLEAFFAVLALGARPANVNPRYNAREIRPLLLDCEATAFVFADSLEQEAAAALDGLGVAPVVVGRSGSGRLDIDELAMKPAHPVREPGIDDELLLYTGGTTGAPKGVVWTVDDHYVQLLQIIRPGELPPVADEIAGRRPAPTSMPASPMAHPTALGLALTTLVGGGKLVLSESSGFDPDDCLDLVIEEEVRVLGIVGDTFSRPLVEALRRRQPQRRPQSLLAISSSGAFWGADTRAELEELLPGIRLIDNYGSTEGIVTRGRADDPTFQPRDNVIVLAPDGTRVPASGGVGVIAHSGRLPLRYLNDPERTARTFRELDGVRYLVSGDNAELLPNGRIRLLGRGSGTINTGGEKVWPEEVELVLRTHPDVLDAVVVGRPDERWGQRVCALLVLATGSTAADDELYAFARERLAGYKCPKEWIRRDRIPRTIVGKPDYRQIALELAEA